ncbi:MAG: Mut7-C RNAse domain-containing protein [Bacillota bacterium]
MKKVYFRFYGELNDFFKKNPEQKIRTYSFRGRQTVKDCAESMGVPHTEIAAVMQNSRPSDFSALVKNNDYLSVFPAMGIFNVPQEMQLREPYRGEYKFILDSHLGKLARYLRMLGFDTLYKIDYQDSELAEISVRENRILLTRDLGLLKRAKIIYGFFIRDDEPALQLKAVLKRYKLKNKISTFGRCMECNTELIPVDKEKIMDRLEPKTKKYFHKFYLCPDCSKIYWQGSHFAEMNNFINEILEELKN